jgi:hypothetical protein
MASDKGNKAYSLRMTKQASKKVANNKPSQFKKKGDFKPGGTFSTGRAIKAMPLTSAEKKAKLSSTRQVGGRAKEGLGKLSGGVGRVGSGEMKELKGTGKGSGKSYVKATGAVASKGQAMRKADAASSAKRRKSGTTRGSRGMY